MVGPGLATFYFAESGSGWSFAVLSFFENIKSRFPTGMTFSVPNSGDLIDVATGEISGGWVDGTANTVNATGTALYAQGVGGRVKWATAGTRNGRHIHGTTFLVPLDGTVMTSSGTLSGVVCTQIATQAKTLIDDANNVLTIYSRPTASLPGQASAVTAASVPTTISTLRSRRT